MKNRLMILLISACLLLSPGCSSLIQATEKGFAPFGGVRLDVFGIVIGVAEVHPIGLLALLDLPLSLTFDIIFLFPSLIMNAPYVQIFP